MSFPGLSTYTVTIALAIGYLIFLKILLGRQVLTVQARVVFGLAGIIVFLEVFSLVSRSIPSPVLQWLFDPDKEKNLIATFSSMLLLSTGIPALLIGLRSPRQANSNWPTAVYWTLFGAIFLFLGFDEYFLIHERLANWHLIYALFGGTLAAVTAGVAWFFDRGRLRLYVLIFFALACIGGGGVGFDLPSSPIPFNYIFRITIEEFLEMIGSSLILFVTLTYLQQYSTPARWRLNARLLPVVNILWVLGAVFWTFWPLSWLEVPQATEQINVQFLDGDLAFIAYHLEDPANAGTYLDIAEYWQANAQLYGTYAHALILLDPQTRASIIQVNVPMHPDLPPTEGWIPRFIYKKNVHIPLDGIQPGTYLLALQAWEEPAAEPKLTITTTDQELITPDVVVLGEIVIP